MNFLLLCESVCVHVCVCVYCVCVCVCMCVGGLGVGGGVQSVQRNYFIVIENPCYNF